MFTRKDFRQLFFREKEIEAFELEKMDIRIRKGMSCTQNYENMDMPRGTGSSDKVSEAAADLCVVDEVIDYAKTQQEREYAKLIRYINGIEDAEMRCIIHYRYALNWKWSWVAKKLHKSIDAVKAKDRRFFEKLKSDTFDTF